ncbi:MAG: (2Fe-2S)-binding protein [Hyphomicrobiaceae bacterium]|nr:MAG: (2Fe-2S)-binding protein [Hyphomicrobiaceae bacterium]
MKTAVSIIVNDRRCETEVPTTMLLVDFLREVAGSKGTVVGCDTGQCGCCTVHVDGDAVKSCTMLTAQADGASILTIEGLASADGMHPMQRAFHEHHALQCGYCTAGIVMNAVDIVTKHHELDERTIRRLIEGNLCRCTGYSNIVDAILEAAREAKRGA